MFDELEVVVLTHDVDDYMLKGGDVGTIVGRYADGKGYEVEFLTTTGDTIAVLTLTETDLRRQSPNEIHHVRELVTG